MTELTKPINRKIHVAGHGDYVVTLRPDGVALRGRRKQKAIVVPWEMLARSGLEAGGWSLSAGEWDDPLRTVARLGRLPKAARRKED